MKHLFFAIHYLELGGAERSLVGLLRALDYSKVQVDLFIYSHRGELIKAIPQEVDLLPEIPEYAQIERPLKEVLQDGYLRLFLARIRAKWHFAQYRKKSHPNDGNAIFSYVSKNVTPLLPPINPEVEYDLAISSWPRTTSFWKRSMHEKRLAGSIRIIQWWMLTLTWNSLFGANTTI